MHIRPADISELTAQVPLCVRVSHPAAADHGHQPPDEAGVRPRHLPRRPRQAHPGTQAQVPLLPPGTKPFGRQTDLLLIFFDRIYCVLPYKLNTFLTNESA